MGASAVAHARPGGISKADLHGLHDAELLRLRHEGSASAGEELADRWRRTLIGYYVNHLQDTEAAEDLAHDVLANALSVLDRLDPDRPVWPWLMTIARNRLVDHYRRQGTRGTSLRLGDGDSVAESPCEPSDLQELLEGLDAVADRPALRQAISQLTSRQRFAILRHDVDEWTTDQIAAVLETSRNGVQQLLVRARRSARREYLRLTGGQGPWALVPWPVLWLRDRARRAVDRTRQTAQDWQLALSAGEAMSAATSVAAILLVTSVVGAGLGSQPAVATERMPTSASSVTVAIPSPSEPLAPSVPLVDPSMIANAADGREGSEADTASSTEPATDAAEVPDAIDLAETGVSVDPMIDARESDRYENGKQLDSGASLEVDTPLQPVDAYTHGSTQVNCDSNTMSTACDPAASGDSVEDSSVTVAADTAEGDVGDDNVASDTAQHVEDDASQFEVLTDDNCELADPLTAACDQVKD